MCIRDGADGEDRALQRPPLGFCRPLRRALHRLGRRGRLAACPLYTSDAADDLLCVDLGGRRTYRTHTYTFDYSSDTLAVHLFCPLIIANINV